MLRYLLHSLGLFSAFRCAYAIPTGATHSLHKLWEPEGNASMALPLLERDDDDLFDPTDLSFIKKIAAIGDSYSAGIGAGNKLGSLVNPLPGSDFACSRYDHAYPYLIHSDTRLGGQDQHSFQFLSCSGAVTADVINKQIPNLKADQDVILVSAGGNDAELTNILNQCVYQWSVLNPKQVPVAKLLALDEAYEWAKDVDWDSLGRGCEGQLAHSQDIINSKTFSSSLDAVLAGAKAKLGFDGMIFLTGYAKFWDEAYTSKCDSVTWTMWIYKAWNFFQPAERLTAAHRKTMNALVDSVNAKLSEAADRAGAQVKFVNYDNYVGEFNGRFCAPGVDESSSESNTRTGLMFYEFRTMDVFNALPWKRSEESAVEDTFSGSQNIFARITILMDPDASYAPRDGENTSIATTLDFVPAAKNVIPDPTSVILKLLPNLLPDGWARVFHPQPLLHQLIANLVIYEMVNHRQVSNGFGPIPEVQEYDSCPLDPGTGGDEDSIGGGQQIALASYINPLGDPASWERIFTYDSQKVSVLVANVLNGPDYVVDENWKSVIDKAASQGKRILGYVRTGYLGVSQQKFTTRLGSHELADWASQIEQDVAKWFELYGASLSGIFFDEGWPECGPNNIYADLYAYINNYTKRKRPGAFTVLNPGSPIAQCYENTMDTLLTFESSYETYTTSYVPNDWTPKDPRKIWHIIYRVPQDQIANVAALARSRHSGLLEITDDDQPNPYDNLPNEAYMQAVIGAIPGGTPRINDPVTTTGSQVAGIPNDAVVSSSDYSSVTLTWSSVENALGYAVYKNGALVLELPASLTRATVGMLDPGSSGITFEIRTILASGSGGSSRLISASTKSLPANGTIANVGFTQNGDTVTYKADVLVPYAFVRLFIGINQPSIGVGRGWPIDTPDPRGFATHEIVNYLVEGNDFYSGFYKYSGAWYEGTKANADWSWTSIGVAPQSQNGYTYTWNVPFAGTDAVASEYIIQGQGYAPYKNVFMGTLRSYTSLF